ncbi:biotin--[acetyl-CoA-carboxylase] ligase [Niveibacterium sp. SC-1]|uniref:biotin--[acetyl-CoA-carboxylase] ligase n=1 Tax=Niveibacterium sp. SC-1 TaxID=3135646 RepID=UPI00311FCA1D
MALPFAVPAVTVATDSELSRVRTLLGARAARFDLAVLPQCASTNTLLAERASGGAPSGSVIWALEQTAGRGRRGRVWQSKAGDSLTFSLLWRFTTSSALAGLSLAVGLAVAQAMETLGARGVQLKWPNDIWLDGRKLGGILVELQQVGTRCAAIIGIGVNLQPPSAAGIDQEVAGLSQALQPVPEAAQVLAAILTSLGPVLDRFADEGFAPFQADWMARHALQAQAVRLVDDRTSLDAVCLGVDPEGALLLDVGGNVRRILGGDVSLRGAR